MIESGYTLLASGQSSELIKKTISWDGSKRVHLYGITTHLSNRGAPPIDIYSSQTVSVDDFMKIKDECPVTILAQKEIVGQQSEKDSNEEA